MSLIKLHGLQDTATDLDILHDQPEHVFLPLVPPLGLVLRQLPQPTAQLLRLGLCRRLPRRDVTPHPCILPASAALDALAQRGTLSQELLLPCAPHLVQVDGSFPLTEPSAGYRSTTEDRENVEFLCNSFKFNSLSPSCVHIIMNLCPSCLHTTAAFRSFQPESQILPQSPWRYTSTRPSFLLLPPTRRTRGPDRKKKTISHSYSCLCIHILRLHPLGVSCTSTGGVKCHLQPAVSLFSLYSHSNGLCVDRRRTTSGELRQ